jgi:hypothetical protein
MSASKCFKIRVHRCSSVVDHAFPDDAASDGALNGLDWIGFYKYAAPTALRLQIFAVKKIPLRSLRSFAAERFCVICDKKIRA